LVLLIVQVRIIVIPVVIALLLSSLLYPIVHLFERRGWSRGLGVLAALVTFVIVVTTLVCLIVTQLRSTYDGLDSRAAKGWSDFLAWIETAPFGLTADQVDGFVSQIWKTLDENQGQIWTGALAVTTTATQVIAGALLTMFALIF